MTTYKKLLGLEETNAGSQATSPDNVESKKRVEKLLERAWDVRNFEIELFWKRTAYFSALVGALFVGFYNIDSAEGNLKTFLYQMLVASLGCISSFIWWLSNRGSKFWQKNWEKHIDLLEKTTKSGDIYQLILGERHNAFSVSKLCTIFSFITLIAWGFLILSIIIYSVLKDEMLNSWTKDNFYIIAVLMSIFSFSLLVLILVLIFRKCKTDFSKVAKDDKDKYIKDGKGSNIDGRDIKYLKREIL